MTSQQQQTGARLSTSAATVPLLFRPEYRAAQGLSSTNRHTPITLDRSPAAVGDAASRVHLRVAQRWVICLPITLRDTCCTIPAADGHSTYNQLECCCLLQSGQAAADGHTPLAACPLAEWECSAPKIVQGQKSCLCCHHTTQVAPTVSPQRSAA
ncbi:hypothetical protein COO60DRAFT_390688 [Scenedesmus sp. NREL 46B-D3]|nr:hypothetical protein COO60DRAFT_390688 [Scenedesmus sp. NREL 46B-D3]